MTLHASTPGHPTVRIADPAALVAAVPVLIGFRPRDSLVLVAGCGPGGRRLGLTLRVDLPPPRDVEAVGDMAAANLLLGDPTEAAVIVVGGVRSGRRGTRATPGRTGPPRRDVADAAVAALDARGVSARTVLWAGRCQAGARWVCYGDCGCGGLVPDPGGTAVAALAVAHGQVVYGDRADLERLVAPVPAAVRRRRARMLARSSAAAVPETGPAADLATASALVGAAIEDAVHGRLTLDDEAVVGLVQALAQPVVRDGALLSCAGPDAAAAEQLWAALARETPDPQAAVPAALLAVSALLRGSGALANVALDRAERAWPGHRLTRLLRAAADTGLRPDQVRSWLEER